MSSTSAYPVPTFGEKVFFRFVGLVLLFVPTFVNVILGIGEYNQPEETPAVFVAWTAILLVFLTVSLCVILATWEAFSVRIQSVGITAACFSGVVRFPVFVRQWQLGLVLIPFAFLFYKNILPWLWDALLTELNMPGRIYEVKPSAAAQPQASNDDELLPLFSASAEDEDSSPGDNADDVHPKATRATEPLSPYSTQPTVTASGSMPQTAIQVENGGPMAADAATVV
ncbi:hypothetical protein C8R44DRAFT_875801 [Mycena epipterygia]|nr:hypothetical protein C8R44DRAFT_875801 [Mycena epipterygia]